MPNKASNLFLFIYPDEMINNFDDFSENYVRFLKFVSH